MFVSIVTSGDNVASDPNLFSFYFGPISQLQRG